MSADDQNANRADKATVEDKATDGAPRADEAATESTQTTGATSVKGDDETSATPAASGNDDAGEAAQEGAAEADEKSATESTGEPSPETATEAAPAQANQPKKPRVHPREAVKQFEAAWPEAFSSDPKQVKPLAIGILQQILADRPAELDGLNSKAIRAAMKFYTSRLSYHIAMKNAEHRVDLKGEPAEPVDDKARGHAEEQIKAIHAARDAKRAEQGETEDGGEKKPRRPRKAAGRPSGPRKDAKSAPRGDGGKRRSEGRPSKGDKPRKENQPDPALKNMSMEEKLDRLAQRFGQDGVK
ncbi:ProQ/FinO family protein [Guyparkeria hydrothermalis]|uniref:ProQ/FINO family protein n=1 Tax=Guyparkeria hydrothermalis TaxID=923 RepID=UPI002022782B|nr:ProQ/FinO family protein [Guyparkeria hydrothermalis]MCL7750727.1 ProQ/FinO family protein [Guyparkeria hydrothermalis]